MQQRISDAFLVELEANIDDGVKVLRDLYGDLRDTRQALAASEAREKGLREALETAFREGFTYGSDGADNASQESVSWLDSNAYAYLIQTPIESTTQEPTK